MERYPTEVLEYSLTDVSADKSIKIDVDTEGKAIARFCFEVNEGCPDFAISWLTSWLNDRLGKGESFKNGQMIPFGWSILQCRLKDDTLFLMGPDFQSMPITWSDNLTLAFLHIMEHRFIPSSFDLEMEMPSIIETSVVGKGFDSLPMMMTRRAKSDKNPQDSGWYMGSIRKDVDTNTKDFIKKTSLYEAGLLAPFIIRYLSMPVGTRVVFEKKMAHVFFRENPIQPKPGSYLAEKILKEK